MQFCMIVAVALTVSGCAAGSAYTVSSEIANGRAKFSPEDSTGKVIVAEIFGTRDIGLDLNDREQRHAFALSATSSQCGSPSIISDSVTNMGKTFIGLPINSYRLRIECPNGASQPSP